MLECGIRFIAWIIWCCIIDACTWDVFISKFVTSIRQKKKHTHIIPISICAFCDRNSFTSFWRIFESTKWIQCYIRWNLSRMPSLIWKPQRYHFHSFINNIAIVEAGVSIWKPYRMYRNRCVRLYPTQFVYRFLLFINLVYVLICCVYKQPPKMHVHSNVMFDIPI